MGDNRVRRPSVKEKGYHDAGNGATRSRETVARRGMRGKGIDNW